MKLPIYSPSSHVSILQIVPNITTLIQYILPKIVPLWIYN